MEKNNEAFQIDFLEVRESLIDSYNKLINTINNSIEKDETGHKVLKIETLKLKEELFQLGKIISMLSSVYKVDGKEISLPDKKIEIFNS